MIQLSMRDRFALMVRAVQGVFPTDPNTVGGRLLGGVIQPGGTPPGRGIKDYLQSYSEMPWLHAVASRVSYDVAAVRWQFLAERRVNAKGERKAVKNRAIQTAIGDDRHALIRHGIKAGDIDPLTNHPILDLLDRPNPVQTGLMMRRVTQLHLDLAGDAFWLIERDALGTPIALWPIPPHWILGTPHPRRPFYRVSFRGWQGTIPEHEFIWFSDIDPLNPYGRGTGNAQALADELETDEYASKHVKAYFYNHARPDLIIYPKNGGNLEEDQVERLEESWNAHNQGFWRAFKPFFLKREVEIKQVEQNFRSQQMVQLREFERNTILQIFGVSPETLGILSTGSNRATVTMGDHIYGKRVVVPRLELQRTVIQERLVPQFDDRIIAEYESPVARDKELELMAAKEAPWGPTIDQWREMQGLEPLPNGKGEVHVIDPKFTTTTFDAPIVVQTPAADPPADPAATPGTPADQQNPDEADAAAAAIDLVLFKAAGDDDEAALLRTLAFKSEDPDDPAATRLAERQVPKYRRRQEREWTTLAANINAGLLAGAVARGDEDGMLAAIGIGNLSAALSGPLKDLGAPAFLLGAELALNGLPVMPRRAPLGISLSQMNPEAARWAERSAAALVRNVTPETREAIRALIVHATSIGLTPQEVASRIRGLVGLLPAQVTAVARFEARLLRDGVAPDVAARRTLRYAEAQRRYRAITIARTELMSATNEGQQALWQFAKRQGILPAAARRVWIATHDDRLDKQICEPLDGTTTSLDEPFSNGSMVPPAHPRCRCAVGLSVIP